MTSVAGQDVAILPEFFRPRSGVPLVRIGRDNDGGYLIDRRNLDHTEMLINMGVFNDWSFEEHFLSKRTVPLICYDRTVSAWKFFIKLYTHMFLFEPVNSWNALKPFVAYLRFFNSTTRIHRKENIASENGDGVVSPETVLTRDVPSDCRNLFFNIDIEGSEYQILDSLVAHADRIEGLAIEFHDVDRNIARIHRFIRDFPLALCHVHPNNHALVLDDRTPTVVECTFTRRPADGTGTVDLPHELDMRNTLKQPELSVEFRDIREADRIGIT